MKIEINEQIAGTFANPFFQLRKIFLYTFIIWLFFTVLFLIFDSKPFLTRLLYGIVGQIVTPTLFTVLSALFIYPIYFYKKNRLKLISFDYSNDNLIINVNNKKKLESNTENINDIKIIKTIINGLESGEHLTIKYLNRKNRTKEFKLNLNYIILSDKLLLVRLIESIKKN